MNTISELDALINEINAELDNSENLPDTKGYYYIELVDCLKSIKSNLENEKFKFVFIGQKGIGKTTTILELFGLSKKVNGKTADLLATASGGTTTCEVELFKSDTDCTYFTIEPISDDLFNQYLDDFCVTYNTEKEISDDNQYLPTEISRSFRNMIGLKKSEISDVRKTFATSEQFKEELLKRINKNNRTETIITCEKKEGGYFLDCKEKFHQINLCKMQNTFLPKKINIYLTKDILDFDKYPEINSIVDTRGIDTAVLSGTKSNKMKRQDILNYIEKEQNKCLFFFVDNIKPAPSPNITDLLKTMTTEENSFRFYIIINVFGTEAEDVMTDDGKAATKEEGIEYKKDDILSKFRQIKLEFKDNNLLFYNSKENYPDREDIFTSIFNNIAGQQASSYKFCDEIKTEFEKLKYDFENNDYAMDNFKQLKEVSEQVNTPVDVFNSILNDFLSELRSIHHARLAAINRYYGDYYFFDFFHEFSLIVESVFDGCFSRAKEKIIDRVNVFMRYRNISNLEKLNYKVFLKKFESNYNECRTYLKDFLKEKLKETFDIERWEAAINEYGKGTGYKERVLDIYKNALETFDKTINVKNEYENCWNKIINSQTLLKDRQVDLADKR